MFMGFDVFNPATNPTYKNIVYTGENDVVEVSNMLIDELFIDTSVKIPYSIDKPNKWELSTVINAKLQGDLEGGNIKVSGLMVDSIRFQKRRIDSLEWIDVGELPFETDVLKQYKLLDKNIQNDYIYEYSIIPIAQGILGNRITSEEVKAEFEGLFISDKDNNYAMFYDLDMGDITHNTSTNSTELLNSPYPIITTGSSNYKTGSINAIYVYGEADKGLNNIKIRQEHLAREQLIRFLTNGKPKVIRMANGNTMIVSVVGNPIETPVVGSHGMMEVSFDYVEIDDFTTQGLKSNNLLDSFKGGEV